MSANRSVSLSSCLLAVRVRVWVWVRVWVRVRVKVRDEVPRDRKRRCAARFNHRLLFSNPMVSCYDDLQRPQTHNGHFVLFGAEREGGKVKVETKCPLSVYKALKHITDTALLFGAGSVFGRQWRDKVKHICRRVVLSCFCLLVVVLSCLILSCLVLSRLSCCLVFLLSCLVFVQSRVLSLVLCVALPSLSVVLSCLSGVCVVVESCCWPTLDSALDLAVRVER